MRYAERSSGMLGIEGEGSAIMDIWESSGSWRVIYVMRLSC
jgi:hypothetical protein